MTIESICVLGAVAVVVYGIIRWFRSGKKVSQDPWGPEVEQLLQDPDLPPLCHRCFTPQSPGAWFCPECGAAVGQYNNYMPYLNAFSEGEVMRAGTHDHLRHSFLVVFGYICLSFSYYIFAPVFWYYLFRNLSRHPQTPGAGPGTAHGG
jgi:hypothetical protein